MDAKRAPGSRRTSQRTAALAASPASVQPAKAQTSAGERNSGTVSMSRPSAMASSYGVRSSTCQVRLTGHRRLVADDLEPRTADSDESERPAQRLIPGLGSGDADDD